jgi:hypothetical protein
MHQINGLFVDGVVKDLRGKINNDLLERVGWSEEEKNNPSN